MSAGWRPTASPERGRIRLLFVATVPQPLRNFYIPYAAYFRGLGWRVEAAAHGASAEPALEAAFDRVHELPLSRSVLDPRNLTRGLPAVSRLVADGPDIVHVHTPIAAFLIRLAVRRLPAPDRPCVVYTAHGFHFHRGGSPVANLLFRTAERIAGRWTDRLVVINDDDEAAALAARIVPRRRLVRMPGVGIDMERYSRAAVPEEAVGRARRMFDVPDVAPIFVLVGELHPNKRQGDALAALAAMAHRDAHLVVAGRGRSEPRLRRAAATLGVTDRVHFAGFVDDVRPLVVAATGLVCASRREGLNRAIIEALALGTPVIASTARGNAELVGDGRGILFPTGDVRALARAMDRLIDEPEVAGVMALRGRARAVERYRLDEVIAIHERIYEEVLRNGRRGT